MLWVTYNTLACLVALMKRVESAFVVLRLDIELRYLFQGLSRWNCTSSDTFLPNVERSLYRLDRQGQVSALAVDDADVKMTVSTGRVHRVELLFADEQGLLEARHRSLILSQFHIVHSHQEVAVACFERIFPVVPEVVLFSLFYYLSISLT